MEIIVQIYSGHAEFCYTVLVSSARGRHPLYQTLKRRLVKGASEGMRLSRVSSSYA